MRSLAWLATLSLAVGQFPAAAANKAPISLPKTTKWEMNYDIDACHLFARFGNGVDSALLSLTRTAPGDYVQMTIFSKVLKFDGIAMPVQVAFGGQAIPFSRTGVAITAGDDKVPGVIIEGLRLDGWEPPKSTREPVQAPGLTSAAEAAANSITIKRKGGKAYRLETGSMAAPMAAMRTCTDDLLVQWGFDPKVQATLSRQAQPASNPGTWFRSGDFPEKALHRGQNGIVRFRLDVAPSGAVTGCRILFRTNPDEFADLSCKLLMVRAQMKPALDAAGQPVKSYYISRINWVAGEW
ncbi:MAG: energy transducer TonB [Novosphingobium sp.]|uniref:energy transducer TonB n=1 Tax=Novosphingobium sp. TaxID=1874826 RepID=UPI0032B9C1D9